MEDEYAKHELEFIKEYQEKGFTDNFRIAKGKLISSETGQEFEPTDLMIMGENRFEGMSNPSDLSILYAIKAPDELKGTLLMAYGPNADISEHHFIEQIPEADQTDRVDEPL